MKPVVKWFQSDDPMKVFVLSDTELQQRVREITLPEDSWRSLTPAQIRRVVEFAGASGCAGHLNKRWRLVSCRVMISKFLGNKSSSNILLQETGLRITKALNQLTGEHQPETLVLVMVAMLVMVVVAVVTRVISGCIGVGVGK